MIEHIQQLRGESHADALANAKVPWSVQTSRQAPCPFGALRSPKP